MTTIKKRLLGAAMTAGILGVGCSTATAVTPPTDFAVQSHLAQTPIEQALSQASAYFITQYHHAVYNPTAEGDNNANCGPTSLAMALKAFGVAPSGLTDPAHAQDLIRDVRVAMTGQDDEDSWTYPAQVQQAARKFGLQSDMVYTLADIKQAMSQPGRLMVININPSPAYIDQLVVNFNGGHFALLTKIDGDKAYLNDPLATQPIVISLEQLNKALTTPLGQDPDGHQVAAFDGGVLLWKNS
ncbi:MAG TPA: C39 family peptidase [Oscillatoriaceae cyanobacterium]